MSLRRVIFWILLFKRSFSSPPAFTMVQLLGRSENAVHTHTHMVDLSFYRYEPLATIVKKSDFLI